MFSDKRPESYHIGAIDPHCDVLAVLEDAFNNAKFLCDQYYLCSPDGEYISKNGLDIIFILVIKRNCALNVLF